MDRVYSAQYLPMKDSFSRQGISIDERVPLPEHMIPADARVEIEAKIAAGYFTGNGHSTVARPTVGRNLHE